MIHKHTMLEADMISRRYRCAGKGQVYAVNNLSLKIHTGECHGIVGESGCGKRISMQRPKRLLANHLEILPI